MQETIEYKLSYNKSSSQYDLIVKDTVNMTVDCVENIQALSWLVSQKPNPERPLAAKENIK